MVLLARYSESPPFSWFGMKLSKDEFLYHDWTVVIAGVGAIGLLMYFRSLKWNASEEEALQEALDHEGAQEEPAADVAADSA